MSAQIIPFPDQHIRARETAPLGIALDPTYRAWCAAQNRRAAELGLPLPLRSELHARYLRGEGNSERQMIDGNPSFWTFCARQNRLSDELGEERPRYAELREQWVRGER